MNQTCPIRNIFNTLSKRWMLNILKTIHDGHVGFNQIKNSIPGITGKVLSERLTELTEEGILDRQIIQEKPIRVEYRFTPQGDKLGQSIKMLSDMNTEKIL